ncbi:DUF1269 domain-containing protein [Enterococcus asini]|uniref:DUF1269 domain-containing protein n=1 Tax=Enterococcus TaxID=1350 RepID=UPI00288E5457|nr:DUF1269 domain-containing protein [Enterococcus asini]MDT2757803.1 DUF1269 domain-containing protein [Enterococcus asini]
MTKRVIVMNFEVESQAYQAFSEIKKMAIARQIKGEQMAVVTHSADGQHKFQIDDFLDFTGSNKASTGGLIGMLVGVFVGPLAMLLGWMGGSVIGASRDAKEVQNARNIFEFLLSNIGEGQTGLILIAEEEDNRPINDLIMYQLGGGVTRFDYEEVEAEIKKAKDLEEEAKNKTKEAWAAKHPETEEASPSDESEQ